MSVTSDKKLWLFGDSFLSEQPEGTPTEILQKTWFNQIAMLLHADVHNTAVNGSSLDYLITMLLENKDAMSSGDYAIFVLSEPSRRWFIQDRPDWGNLNMRGGYSQYPVKKVVAAIDAYKNHLQNEASLMSLYYGAIGIINHVCLYHGIKFAVLPAFTPHITVNYMESPKSAYKHLSHKITEISPMGKMCSVTGNLTTISTEEMGDGNENGNAKNTWHNIVSDKWHGCDQRLNHLSEPNHEILAKKVYNCLVMGQHIDLTSNFQNSLINEDNYTDVNPDNIYNHVYGPADIISNEAIASREHKLKLF